MNIKDAWAKSTLFVTSTLKKGASYTIMLVFASIIAFQNFSPFNIWFFKSIPGLKTEIKEMNEKISLKEEELKKCIDGNKELTKGIDEQNKYIDKLFDNTIALQDQFNQAAKNLAVQRKQNSSRISAIMNQSTPKTCDEAIQHLINARETLQWPD